jgi:hypothetical protein
MAPPPANTPTPGANTSARKNAAASASRSSPATTTGSTLRAKKASTSMIAPIAPPNPTPGVANS